MGKYINQLINYFKISSYPVENICILSSLDIEQDNVLAGLKDR
jgi:hypothetical protein